MKIRLDYMLVRVIYILLLLLFLILLSGCNITGEKSIEQDTKIGKEGIDKEIIKVDEALLERKPDVGYLAPNFSFKNANGETIDLNSLKGKPIFINFWASW